MAKPTLNFRQLWRNEPDGKGETPRVLVLQQWHQVEGWEHPSILKKGGYWDDVPVTIIDYEHGPKEPVPMPACI